MGKVVRKLSSKTSSSRNMKDQRLKASSYLRISTFGMGTSAYMEKN